jgi:GT2 family glycosyltransferase
LLQFSFIQYTQPGWYFNLQPTAEIFSSTAFLKNFTQTNGVEIEIDNHYETDAAKQADIGYRLWNMGVLLQANNTEMETIKSLGKPSINDEYRFVAKYWGKLWCYVALGCRLAAFKNPFKEVDACFKAAATPRFLLHKEIFNHTDSYTTFQSSLLVQQPLVSVIIPTLNRYIYLKDVLEDLEKQLYTNFDVIIVDQTEDFNENFYQQFNLNLTVIQQNEKLLWTARNLAIKKSTANYFLFFDDDSRVEPNWISEHLKCIEYFNADISAGVSLSVVGGKIPVNYQFFRWADQFDSGNALVKKTVFEKIGLFDLQFNKGSMGDNEFGLRAYLAGYKSISNPFAKRVHLKVGSGGLREIGHWDGFRPKKLFAPKPIPSVTYLFKKYFPSHLAKNTLYLGVLLSNLSFKKKSSTKAMVFSVLLTIIKLPILVIQFQKSKKIAAQKIQQGALIEWL